jgi:flagellar protein FliO/FliZ
MDGAGMLLLLRVALSLAVVVGLIWIAGRKLSGTQARRATTGPTLRVVGRQALGRRTGVAVVAIGNRRLLLGYGEQQVTMLTELAPVLEQMPAPAPVRGADQARRASTKPKAVISPEPVLIGLPAARPPLDIDALLARAKIDADTPAGPGSPVADAPVADAPAPTPALVAAADRAPSGPLDGSILSPATWRRALATLQDRTVRR